MSLSGEGGLAGWFPARRGRGGSGAAGALTQSVRPISHLGGTRGRHPARRPPAGRRAAAGAASARLSSASLRTPAGQLLNKVPEVTIRFWIIKILCTTVGESFADWINMNLDVGLTDTAGPEGTARPEPRHGHRGQGTPHAPDLTRLTHRDDAPTHPLRRGRRPPELHPARGSPAAAGVVRSAKSPRENADC
ncbi:hypothetical protein AB0L59_39465 [Streptomyces sp. NPDC052109]|uniref:hypothetical protein n=1 Tax=Streptomyces sp. NPDC052109 TaxID=3155527 RepID=UPI0034492D29